MWIAVIGAPGSCKEAVASRLAKDQGFVIEREEAPTDLLDKFMKDPNAWAYELHLEYLLRRYRLQRQIQKRAGEEDILQIRTFWDTLFVYAAAARARGYLTDAGLRQLQAIHATLEETLEAPALVIYLHGSAMITGDRLALKGRGHHEEDRASLARAYAEFATMLRVSVVDIELVEDYEAMIEEIKAGIEAARSSGAGGQTLWKRSFLK